MISIFLNFIDSLIISKIVSFSNKRLKKGDEPTNATEIKGLIGLLLMLGVTKKNDVNVDKIWSPSSIHNLYYATAILF